MLKSWSAAKVCESMCLAYHNHKINLYHNNICHQCYNHACFCACIYVYVCMYTYVYICIFFFWFLFFTLSPASQYVCLSLSPLFSFTLPTTQRPYSRLHTNTSHCHSNKCPHALIHILYTLPNHYNHCLWTLTDHVVFNCLLLFLLLFCLYWLCERYHQ